MPTYQDPIAQGISQFAVNYVAAQRAKEEDRLRRMQEQEIQRKLDEADNAKRAQENLSNIVAMRAGRGKPIQEQTAESTGLVNMPRGLPGSAFTSPVATERPPSPEELQGQISTEQETLAKRSPDLFFKYSAEKRAEEAQPYRLKKLQAQAARAEALRKDMERMPTEVRLQYQLFLNNFLSGTLDPEQAGPALDAWGEVVKNSTLNKKSKIGPLGKGNKKGGKKVIERRKTAEGRILVKYEDETVKYEDETIDEE